MLSPFYAKNEVQGLEVQTKNGDWAQVMVPENAFTAIVGDTVKAWSNGRLHAARHRVVISGDRDRYSCDCSQRQRRKQ
ncbi:hypothetical protein NC651_017489 [Populus alba x Populus x berolinensis]|nr:hypothetical protein NC651_017489 [Populus alba x Populus x berolinensis]